MSTCSAYPSASSLCSANARRDDNIYRERWNVHGICESVEKQSHEDVPEDDEWPASRTGQWTRDAECRTITRSLDGRVDASVGWTLNVERMVRMVKMKTTASSQHIERSGLAARCRLIISMYYMHTVCTLLPTPVYTRRKYYVSHNINECTLVNVCIGVMDMYVYYVQRHPAPYSGCQRSVTYCHTRGSPPSDLCARADATA